MAKAEALGASGQKRTNVRSPAVPSHECLKNEEADSDGLEEKEDRVELVIALVTRDCSSHQTDEIEHATSEVYWSQGKKVRDAFQQRINNIDRRKQPEKDKERAVIRIVVRLVIDGTIDVAFPRKQ